MLDDVVVMSESLVCVSRRCFYFVVVRSVLVSDDGMSLFMYVRSCSIKDCLLFWRNVLFRVPIV